jgi:hypothetical protein
MNACGFTDLFRDGRRFRCAKCWKLMPKEFETIARSTLPKKVYAPVINVTSAR